MSTFAVCFNRICEMDFLPKDPAILISSVNMLLRDEEFDSQAVSSLKIHRGTKKTRYAKNNLHTSLIFNYLRPRKPINTHPR